MKHQVSSDKGLESQALGLKGELEASRFLQKRGYRILDRNYREQSGARKGELDLVAYSKSLQLLCFVEVKTRTGDSWIRPAAAVNLKKRKMLIRTSMDYLRWRKFPRVSVRFDIIEVWKTEKHSRIFRRSRNVFRIQHIEGAFQLPEGMMYG